jgi:hypothetical protein
VRVQVKVQHPTMSVRDWLFDVVITDVTHIERPSLAFVDMRVNANDYVVRSLRLVFPARAFGEYGRMAIRIWMQIFGPAPTDIVFSPCDSFEHARDAVDLYGHSFNIKVPRGNAAATRRTTRFGRFRPRVATSTLRRCVLRKVPHGGPHPNAARRLHAHAPEPLRRYLRLLCSHTPAHARARTCRFTRTSWTRRLAQAPSCQS